MATEPELSEMWASALAEYEQDTKRTLDRKMLERMRALTAPEDLLVEIEASGQAFRDFRNKRGGLWRKLSAFVPPLVAALRIAIVPLGALADAVGVPGSAVFGALLYLVRSCENVSNAYDWVEEVFGELKRFLDRLTALMQAPLHSLLRDQVIAILVCVLRVIGRSEALIRGSHFRQYLRVTFLGKDEKTTKIIGDFNKLVANEHLIEVSLTLATAQKIENKQEINTTEIRNDIQAVHDAIKEGHHQETAEQIQERIKRILCGTTAADEVQETYHRIKKDLLQGTGAWLRDEPIFQSWIKHQASILWIFGGPGSGKSYLAAWITMQLTENLIDPEYTLDSCVAYFFVKENNKDLRNANNILKTLAWQLCEQDVHFKAHVAAACKGNKNPTFTPEDTWENLFLGYYSGKEPVPTRATILIDGLDEAPRETRQVLLGFLKRLVSASRSTDRISIQFAVVGRNDLRNDMDFTRQEKSYLIKVDKTKNQDDIDSYVRKRLEDVEILRRMRRMKPRGKQDANAAGARIKKRILAGADGVFLWARLLIKMILNKDLAQIEEILREPPETLDDMIESVLDRMASDKDLGHQLLRKMLLYVVYVQRPLRFGELDEFLSLPDRKPNLLLWERARGVLSAVFDLRFPDDRDPDEIEDDEEQEEEDELGESGDEKGNDDGSDQSDDEEGGFDFTGDDEDEDTGADDSNDQEIFAPIASHRLRTSWEVQLRRQNTMTQYQTYLNDAQIKTEITFCHARFKDYLQREGRSRNRNKLVHAIIPETDRVHIEITMICLEVFRLEHSLKDHSRYLVDYPLNYLGFHLSRVDLRQVSDLEFGKVAKGLYWLFGTDRGAICFVLANQDYDLDGMRSSESAFIRNWVTSVENLKLVQTWLGEVESRSTSVDIDQDARVWMQGASESYAELLKCVMMAASKSWLTKQSYDSDEYRVKGYFPCWLMEGWLSLCETCEASAQLGGLDYSYDNVDFLERATPSHLKHLATWAGLERDTHWHSCLGWMLMEGNHLSEAIAHYDMAIQLSPKDAWVAMEGRARCHGEMEEYQEAIDWQRRAIESLPKGMKSIGAFLYPRIADWAAALGDEDTSLEAAKLAIQIDAYGLLAQVRYIEALWRRDDWDQLMYILDWLHRRTTEDDRGYSWLVRLLLQGEYVLNVVGQACRNTGQPTWVLEVLGVVEEQIEKGGSGDDARNSVWWSYHLMLFYYQWYDDCADQVIRLGERFLGSLKQLSPELQRAYEKERSWAVNKLASLYYDRAVAMWDEGRGATKAATFANKLKMLAVSVPTSTAEGFEGFDFFHKDYPALLWGRWLRDFRKVDENAWRESFKVRLLEEMKSLDDDDPANDTDGMATLAVSLFHAGDRKNAAALLAILFQPLETYEPEEDDEDEESEQDQSVVRDDDDEGAKEDDMPQDEAEYSEIADTDDSWEDVKGEEKEDAGPAKVRIQEPQNDEAKEEEPEKREDNRNEQATQIISQTAEKEGQEQQSETLANSNSGTETTPAQPPGPGHLIRRKTMPRDMLALNVEQGSWAYWCDNCKRNASEVDEFYFCEVCHQTHWCGECLAMVRDRTLQPGLGANACSPAHDMYRAWPIDAEARDLAAVYMDGGATLRREWLEDLRASWLGVESDSEREPRYGPAQLEACENPEDYEPGGFHPVHLSDEYDDGRYRIVFKLFWGGFSTVWLARDRTDRRWIALKIVRASDSPDYETRSVAASHPGITDSSLFIVPERRFWIDGPNGRHLCLVLPALGPDLSRLSSGIYTRLNSDFARRVSLQAARALAQFHSLGLCHGDFTASNMVLRLVDDFDSYEKASLLKLFPSSPARFASSTSTSPSPRHLAPPPPPPGSRPGTPAKYLAPEACVGRPLSQASDVWALGCAIFRIRSGNDLFLDWDTDCPVDALDQIVRTIGGDLPEEWAQTRFNEYGYVAEDDERGEPFGSVSAAPRRLDGRVRATVDEPADLFIGSGGDAVLPPVQDGAHPEDELLDDDDDDLALRQPYPSHLRSMVWRPTAVCVGGEYFAAYSDETDRILEAFPKISEPEADLFLLDLLSKIFIYDPVKRLTAEEVVGHPWFLFSG